jgi:RND family efflux transporter MFP subunit
VLLAGSIVAGCNDSRNGSAGNIQPAKKQVAPLRLQTLRPEVREIRDLIIGTGTIGAAQTSNIGVFTPGIVERVFVRVGDRVKKGQPLFHTRKNDYEISVQLARAELTAAEARAEQARLEHKRATDLRGKSFISQAQLDAATNAQKAANAEVGVAQAGLAQAGQSLADTVVRAPYDGVVTARNVDEGTYKSEQTFNADSSVLQLQEIDIVVAVVRVPEIYLSKLSPGTPADLFVDATNEVLQSEISVINDQVDPRSRTIEVRFVLNNEDYQVKPGLFVRAEIHPPARKALLLGLEAVLERSDSPHVFLFKNGVAQKQAIALREHDAARVEIVSGLDENAVILAGPDLSRLADGDPIPDTIDVAR